MNKILLFAQRFPKVFSPIQFVDVDKLPDVVEPDKHLLDAIYGVNPVSHIPEGDLAIFMSKDANPEVRAYIQERLLNETVNSESAFSFGNDVLNKFKGVIDDDDIAFFSRNHNESKEEFSDRIKAYFAAEKSARKRAKDAKDLQDAVERAKKGS